MKKPPFYPLSPHFRRRKRGVKDYQPFPCMGLGLVLTSRSKPTLLLSEAFGVTDFHLEAFQVMSDRIVIAGEHELDEIFPPSEKNPVVETLTNLPIIVPEPLQTQPGGQCGMGLQGAMKERAAEMSCSFCSAGRAFTDRSNEGLNSYLREI